jgi:hypothetical protein
VGGERRVDGQIIDIMGSKVMHTDRCNMIINNECKGSQVGVTNGHES